MVGVRSGWMSALASYKAPDFKERVALADAAKRKALDQLRTKPAPDEALMAERKAAREAREAAAEEKRLAKRALEEQAKEQAREAKRAEAEAAEAARLAKAPVRPVKTEAELKADRDARYAARKGRKS